MPSASSGIARAFTVKSRRARSSSRVSPNVTSSGRRWSEYVPSRRYVVTSWVPSAAGTATVPKRFS